MSISPIVESGAIVICNHWTQFGIGETFPEGEIDGRWYQRNFSTVFGFEAGRKWLEADPRNRICHEYDAYFLEALAAEHPEYLDTIRDLLDRGLMELPGGTFGQAESQVFGYESALRQLIFGQAAYRRHLGRGVETFLVEEQNFFPQLPQLLKLAGFKYASIQFQNSGLTPSLPHDLMLWESPDGTTIPTVPNHPGMLSCARQSPTLDEMAGMNEEERRRTNLDPVSAPAYDDIVTQLAGRKSPLIFQWMELWPPGLDWGASVEPYREAIHALEASGFRQMLLTEYIEWALGRSEAPKVRIPLDQSNYNNNFFLGGWGYENEKTARGSNRCESLLLAAESLCAGDGAKKIRKRVGKRMRDLWARLLVAQNHDPYIAGALPVYIDGLRSFQSELAVKEFAGLQKNLRDKAGLDAPLTPEDRKFRIFNPCPWAVTTPLLLEISELVWPDHDYQIGRNGKQTNVAAVFRADAGRILLGPVLMQLPAYGTADLTIKSSATKTKATPSGNAPKLATRREGHIWTVEEDLLAGIEFEPLVGEWRQVPTYFTGLPPNPNIEACHTRLSDAPVEQLWQKDSDGMAAAAWRQDLMRIREVEQPALSVSGLVFAGAGPTPFVQFNQRLTGPIRFEVGARPTGTWRFRVRVPSTKVRVFADAPFSEELREAETFYCARYVRLEWPGRQLLWCPSQNTLFRRIAEPKATVFECTVFDFGFSGTASWDMRFHAAESFSAAGAMRLAETFHRRPFRIPGDATAGRIAGVAVDHPDVVITHVFPATRGAVGIRLLNASPLASDARITWGEKFQNVNLSDLEGNVVPRNWRHAGKSRHKWAYHFRPWEIATFRVI